MADVLYCYIHYSATPFPCNSFPFHSSRRLSPPPPPIGAPTDRSPRLGGRWYNGKIKRIEAEKKLLLDENEHGAFLIRDSESRRNDYSLSVRDGDTVKHYRIRQLDEGGFFIARRTTFRTLPDLVEHYSRDADGLCVNLRKPCVKVSGGWGRLGRAGVEWGRGLRRYSGTGRRGPGWERVGV